MFLLVLPRWYEGRNRKLHGKRAGFSSARFPWVPSGTDAGLDAGTKVFPGGHTTRRSSSRPLTLVALLDHYNLLGFRLWAPEAEHRARWTG